MGHFMGQNAFVQVLQGDKNTASTGLIKAAHGTVPEDGPLLEGLKGQMPLPHLVAVLEEKDAQAIRVWGPDIQDQANPGQEAVDFGSQSWSKGSLGWVLGIEISLHKTLCLGKTQAAFHFQEIGGSMKINNRLLGHKGLLGEGRQNAE
jgi:hypothetical protein